MLRTESLIMDLGGSLNKVLKMRPGEEVAERDELAMVLVLN